MTLKSLPDLFESTALPNEAASEWERAALACSQKRDTPFNSSMALATPETETPKENFETYLAHWRDLLVANLLAHPNGKTATPDPVIKERMQKLLQVPLWQDSQLATAYVVLNGEILGKQNLPQIQTRVKPTGFALERRELIWTGSNIPNPKTQAELGFSYAIIAHHRGDASLLNTARRIAEWLITCFDVDYCPPASLMEREDQWQQAELLTNLYLLFHGLAILQQDTTFEYIAQRQLQVLQDLLAKANWRIPPYAVVLTSWIESLNRVPQPHRLPLSPVIKDPHAAVAGYRTDNLTWMGTLAGANTGLGYLRFHDVEITNYGPQMGTITETEKFGIVKGVNETSSLPTVLDADNAGRMKLSGRTRLAHYKRTLPGALSQTKKAPIWMDVTQIFEKGCLHLTTDYFTLTHTEKLNFCFFARGEECYLPESDQRLCPTDLNGLKAFAETVVIKGKGSAIEISPVEPDGHLEIHALEGRSRYWGAQFLVAFQFKPTNGTQGWVLRFNA